MRTALTIAGSDSGGGAGIQADLKAFQANGVFGMSAITAITAQNTREVRVAQALSPSLVRSQVDTVFDDLPVHAVKTGMLPTAEIIEVVADCLRARAAALPVVVDPVMISTSGHPLLEPDAVDAFRSLLFPLATVITPNAHEAAHLTRTPVRTLDEARAAAEALVGQGAPAALVKGGHLAGLEDAVDVLFDGAQWWTFRAPRLDTPHTHGTGCTTASAIAANLARGHALPEAIERAKRYVHGAIARAPGLGGGHGPTHHFWFLEGTQLFPADDQRDD